MVCTRYRYSDKLSHAVSSKTPDSYTALLTGQCAKVQHVTPTNRMKEHFASDEWKQVVYWDEQLHAAVNASLDLAISSLGQGAFAHNLRRFRNLQELVETKCADDIKYPCTKSGQMRQSNQTDCLFEDIGCGFACIDAVLNARP